jgi:hypothetical protein
MRNRMLGSTIALIGLVGALMVGLVAVVGVAHAADAEGCQGQATSYDTDGIPIDTASAPGDGGTRDDPLDVLWAGTIEWSGSTEQVLQDGSHSISVAPTGGGVLLESLVGAITGVLPGFSGTLTASRAPTARSRPATSSARRWPRRPTPSSGRSTGRPVSAPARAR